MIGIGDLDSRAMKISIPRGSYLPTALHKIVPTYRDFLQIIYVVHRIDARLLIPYDLVVLMKLLRLDYPSVTKSEVAGSEMCRHQFRLEEKRSAFDREIKWKWIF